MNVIKLSRAQQISVLKSKQQESFIYKNMEGKTKKNEEGRAKGNWLQIGTSISLRNMIKYHIKNSQFKLSTNSEFNVDT